MVDFFFFPVSSVAAGLFFEALLRSQCGLCPSCSLSYNIDDSRLSVGRFRALVDDHRSGMVDL